ncbi:MAG: bL21 family ribosomal protein, partial [bacterium]
MSPGSTVTVEKLEGDPGDPVEFAQVLLHGNEGQVEVGRPLLEGVTVNGVILRQDRGARILV